MRQWEELAEARGWPMEPDPDDYKTEWDIYTQFIMAALCIPFGLLMAFRLAWKSRQHLAADEHGFMAAAGRRIPYSSITGIDKRRWDNKGIADIFFRDEGGRERKARVDAWIFKGGEEILKAIEEATGLGELKDSDPDNPEDMTESELEKGAGDE